MTVQEVAESRLTVAGGRTAVAEVGNAGKGCRSLVDNVVKGENVGKELLSSNSGYSTGFRGSRSFQLQPPAFQQTRNSAMEIAGRPYSVTRCGSDAK